MKPGRSTWILALALCFSTATMAAPGKGKGNGGGNSGGGGGESGDALVSVSDAEWDETAVRKVLAAFAYGGLATDAQISAWADMSPGDAITQILTFNPNNDLLSPPDGGDNSSAHCDSVEAMQDFWSGNDAGNIMKYADRHRYATLSGSGSVSGSNLQRTWTKMISTRGCNPFLHKMAFFLTNYHAAISIHKTRGGLIRSYYDDVLGELIRSGNFVDVMTVAASHAAVARGYGHQNSKYRNNREAFFGTDDFAREFHQLFFRNYGETEDMDYHEDVTIEHTAWMLSGMNLDKEQGAYGATNSNDWWVAPIVFTDHYDLNSSPRYVKNETFHYHSAEGAGSCLEILSNNICGANAGDKIAALAPVAAAHPESLANVPVYMVDFFADDNLDETKSGQIRASWAAANFDMLGFLRAYATSTAFHSSTTYKYKTAFDRNLFLQNMQILTNEENFAKHHNDSPHYRMRDQGAEPFHPAHDVFGGQTGLQAANSRYLFRSAMWANVDNPTFFDDYSDEYTLEAGTDTSPAPVYVWQKDWASVIPVNGNLEHRVDEVAVWLWKRFIGDGGSNFDDIARAQVHAMLATGHDLGYAMDPDNASAVYSSRDITHKKGVARTLDEAHAAYLMNDLSDYNFNKRIGMAINFISVLPYAFVMEGQ